MCIEIKTLVKGFWQQYTSGDIGILTYFDILPGMMAEYANVNDNSYIDMRTGDWTSFLSELEASSKAKCDSNRRDDEYLRRPKKVQNTHLR